MSYYIHQIPGRLRIKSPAVKRSKQAAEAVEALLMPIAGVRSVAVNTLTGSVVVQYYSQIISPGTILHLLIRKGYFNPSKAITHDQLIEEAVSNLGGFLGKTLFGAAIETALEGSAWSLLAALI